MFRSLEGYILSIEIVTICYDRVMAKLNSDISCSNVLKIYVTNKEELISIVK